MAPPKNPANEEAIAEKIYNDILTKIIVEVATGMHRAAKTGVLPYSDVMAGSVVRDEIGEARDGIFNSGQIENKDSGNDDGGLNREIRGADGDANDNTKGSVVADMKSEHTKEQKEEETYINSKKRKADENDEAQHSSKVGVDSNEAHQKESGIDPKQNNVAMAVNTNASANKNSNTPNDGNSSIDPYNDIWGRQPGRECKYQIPCANCGRNITVSRFAQHLEKCNATRPLRSN